MDTPWYAIENVDDVPSPALAVYPARIEENIRRMIRIAGDPARLRPHVKTHKSPAIVRLQLQYGITKFKCSTIAEAEMTAAAGAPDVLLALQPVGPAIARFFALKQRFPATMFSAIVDSEDVIDQVARAALAARTEASLWLDVNAGMNRTGIAPGDEAMRLCALIHARSGVTFAGLHVYDGHIRESDLAARIRICDDGYRPVEAMIAALVQGGLPVPAVVAGGSPAFPVHARRPGVQLSPGTTLLWDAGYGGAFPDIDLLCAAAVVTRVVSKPSAQRVCLDLGTKALATEMPPPRVVLQDIGPHTFVGHNEEHLIIETPDPGRFRIGDVVYGIPIHICPTVARYDRASVIVNGRCTDEWTIAAATRRISI